MKFHYHNTATIKFRFTISYQGEVISLLFEAGAALLVEAHCQYQRLPLAQRNLEPLPRLIVDVEGVSGGEEFGVVPLVAFNALTAVYVPGKPGLG